ncbi:lipopolysaccharide heptosyltransferase II [Vampirovibrio chlorellavorus]|uniref:lipopolysaccharide heptosyltransferase II n=1 Tax=Vampirovibrio chlorellavorus TaxID=758823 RepID=UPI0026F2C4A4|nr:lipopolysaccharide heptosyltransferase II [Vampirovibrio chlorellavorus]
MSHPPAVKPRRKILVIRYRFIGDTLLSVPFLRNLRAAYPDARIDMLVAPNSGEVLRDCPYIDELLWFDTTRKHRYENRAERPQSFWHYVNLLRKRHYDTAFVLKRSFSSAALAFLAGIPERIGFNTEGRGWLLTRAVPYRKHDHEVDSFLSLLEAANIPVLDSHLESWWSDAETSKAEQVLADIKAADPSAKRHVVVHLTSSNIAKQWPSDHARHLVEWLLTRKDCHVHCLGAPSDGPLYEALKANVLSAYRKRVHIHCGQFSLLESMAFLKQMNLVVGVDSGTLHMAAATGVPVVALFGPMNALKWGPPNSRIVQRSLACRPCDLAKPCRHDFACMKDLQPEAVIETIRIYAGFA